MIRRRPSASQQGLTAKQATELKSMLLNMANEIEASLDIFVTGNRALHSYDSEAARAIATKTIETLENGTLKIKRTVDETHQIPKIK